MLLYLNIAYTTQYGNDLYVNIRQSDGTHIKGEIAYWHESDG